MSALPLEFTIETERCRLRAPGEADFPWISDASRNRAFAMGWLGTYQKAGFMTESATAIVNFGFELLGAQEIEACAAHPQRSREGAGGVSRWRQRSLPRHRL